jgi:phytoene desaturase
LPEHRRHKIAVIGSGIAGMATAARLAYNGYNVTVYEKNNYPGGKLGLLLQDGYTFDTGPSLFTQPYVLANLFSDCGKDLKDYLSYQPLHINTQYFYEDGTTLTAYNNHGLLLGEIHDKLGIDTSNVAKFLHTAANAYNNIGTFFLDEPIHEWKTWFSKRIPKALAHLRLPYLLQSMHNYHSAQLKHPKLVQLFDRFATYNGSDPFKAPAMLSMIAHLEMNEGAYYPKGGMMSITHALFNLCKDMGVHFEMNNQVEQIVTDNNTVTGLVVNSVLHHYNLVVSNSDVYFTYRKLLQDNNVAAQLKKQERSSSAVIFYWGINKQFPELDLHNIFFSNDYRAEFNNLFHTKSVYSDPTIYVNITSKMERNHAPEGCENWFVLINTSAQADLQPADIAAIRQHTISKLSRMLNTDMAEHITSEAVLTPAMIESRTGSYMGALYGTASNSPMAAFKRHSNKSMKYKGLYFAGGTVHPGGGIPLCLRSGKLAANAILHQNS